MDYKDLMKKYKVNQVTDEEKQFIEKEIEKYEAMEEYFSENLDDELGNLENIDDAKQNSHETVQLKKKCGSETAQGYPEICINRHGGLDQYILYPLAAR